MTTVPEIFTKMPESFQPDAAKGMNVVIQFDVTGDGGGQWYCDIKDGALEIQNALHENPNLTITVAAQDYIDVSTGKLNAQLAFMTGKLKAKGDLGLAMKMPKLFKE